VETFKEYKVKKVVSTCAHCFNTLKNEYTAFGIELEVVHHTQLLNRLVREGRLTPVREGAGAHKRTITYHDPCYIGRHNGVYSPPRELLQVLPGAEFVEMPRNSERSFCCGAGGARMWMEENIGQRINVARTTEAVGTGADQIAVGCPFCRVMLSDGLTAAIDTGEAREEVEVLDVAQMLLASVKGEMATRRAPAAVASGGTTLDERPVETKAEPEEGDETLTADTVTETSEASPAAKASGGGSSLFDTPADDTTPLEPAETSTAEAPAQPAPASSGGSLFDLGDDSAPVEPVETPAAEAPAGAASGGSLFDIAAPEVVDAPAEPEPEDEQPAEAEQPAGEEPEGLSAGAALSQAATFSDGEPEPEAEEEEPGDEEPAEEKPKPASSGEAHTPKTDVDVNESGSLFDL
ncbi:MAG TPA: (Fe-S)-binding protein, partial [Nocardioides sp.]|nr:(Fe-S)-binding protein [Nocardioides sp.]